jgi:hypothetical protein
LTLGSQEDQAWFWPRVLSELRRVPLAPSDALRALEDASASGFPMCLAEAARQFTDPVVILIDNVHDATDDGLLQGLDLLIRHGPPSLRLLLSGRQPPRLSLARLRAAGELAEVSAADLADAMADQDPTPRALATLRLAGGRQPLRPSSVVVAAMKGVLRNAGAPDRAGGLTGEVVAGRLDLNPHDRPPPGSADS